MSVATPALPVRTERLWAALLAATLMNLPLGSVYAFSVLLRPIEQELGIPRSALSLVFGLATVGFTVGALVLRPVVFPRRMTGLWVALLGVLLLATIRADLHRRLAPLEMQEARVEGGETVVLGRHCDRVRPRIVTWPSAYRAGS